jgi:NADH-quinone oxidoreductase subunit G
VSTDKPTTVKVTIDDHEIEVAPGTLVIRAAEQIGIQIPRFCDHRLLAPLGACRQCLVEVIGQRKPLTACTTTVTDGMVVKTQETSEVARAGQEGTLELLLINHPLDCPMCDKGGECPLQDQALAHGPGETRFVETKRRYEKPIKIGETVLLDRERCVLCARCTRFSAEIAGEPFIELFERGAFEQVAIYSDEPYRSYFSGNVVQICPVGALTSPSYRFQARPFDLTSSEGICNHCAAGCNLRIDARRGLVTRQLARDNDDVNEAWNCDRGRYGFAYGQDPERVLVPHLAENDKLRKASWSEALRRAADGIVAQRGKGVGVLVGGHLTDQDAYALQKLARVALGSNNVDARTWPGSQAETAVAARIAGKGPDRAVAYADLERARAVVVVDLDPHEESPILFLRLRKAARRGVRVFAVGPRAGRLAEFAVVVPTVPGGEADALAALARGEGEDAGGRLLTEPPEPPAPAGPVVVLAGWRAAASGALGAAARLADDLGGAFAWVPRRAGDRGALDSGARPDLLPGGRLVSDDSARAELGEAWGAQPPVAPGLDGPAIVRAAAEGRLGVLLLAGVDLVRDYGPRGLAEQALDNTFVVAIDHGLNATTERADVLLPGVLHAEAEGTYTDWEGRVQTHHPAVPVGGAAQAVWELADQLAARLGVDLGLATLDRVAAEVERFRPPPADLQAPPLPEAPAAASAAEPGAAARPGASAAEPGAAAEAQPREGLALVTYPLLLDGASMLARADDLRRATLPAFVELHPDDAKPLGVTDGAAVEVDFGEDRVVKLPARVSAAVAPGCAFIPTNQPDLALGELLGAAPAQRVTLRAVEEVAA